VIGKVLLKVPFPLIVSPHPPPPSTLFFLLLLFLILPCFRLKLKDHEEIGKQEENRIYNSEVMAV
jgi:hypothetical protein